MKLIRVDLKTGEVLRGRDGLAINCKPGEPGVLVGKVIMGKLSTCVVLLWCFMIKLQ